MTGVLARYWRATSYRNKVAWLATATSGLAVVVLSGVLSAIYFVNLNQEAEAAASSQAKLIAINSEAPLAFKDQALASETLSVLRAVPEIASAALFDHRGVLFAKYRRQNDAGPFYMLAALHRTADHARWLVVHHPVGEADTLGIVQLVYDRRAIWRRFMAILMLSLGAAVGAMLTGLLVGRRIGLQLVKPIFELAATANRISLSKDYALRARKLSDDELGSMTDAFNGMLDQIQHQEEALAAAHAGREKLLGSERSARALAERASQMKDEFLATLSHELRTPLTPILGWVEVLKRKRFPDVQLAQGLEVIERNARMQTQIIEDLLDMSRIVSGKARLDIVRVNLVELIEVGVATVRPAAEAREIELAMSLDPSAGVMHGDPNRLQQIIWNLLTNAIKFTPRGGRVQISLIRRDAEMVMEVTDTGQGIASAFLPHVFERFRQADSSTTRPHGGLGLGLAVVKQLVELHGGSVAAYSSGKGQGTTFTVRLPITRTKEVNDSRPLDSISQTSFSDRVDTSLDAPSLAGLRALVIDDDDDARTLIATLLEERGARVVVADTAEDALALLQNTLPHILISDIGMPDVDGYELMRRIRALPAAQGGRTPGIALTAFARSEDRKRSLQAGYQLHLTKPVEVGELIAAVARIAAGPTSPSVH